MLRPTNPIPIAAPTTTGTLPSLRSSIIA
jgi:hypothetical protein